MAESVDGVTNAGDSTDGKGLSSSIFSRRPEPLRTAVADEDEYNMSNPKRGMAIIINNKDFDPKTEMSERKGTDVDAQIMYNKLKGLGFEVISKRNQKRNEMFRLLREASEADHSQNDCFLCVILSHGDDGIVYGTDGILEVEMLVNMFKGLKSKTLIGKPKIFLIQACRGHELMEGVKADTIGDGAKQKIPSEADVLVAYSTVPGFYSWRNNANGSWFVQAIARALNHYGSSLDLLRMMVRVSRMVALDFESNAPGDMRGKKQVPQIVSTLTKDIYFRPKQSSMDMS